MKQTPIRIDSEKCVGCGLCEKDCVGHVIRVENGKAKALDGCIECGHCFAICPAGAVEMTGYDTVDCDALTPMTDMDSDTLLRAMMSRRTIRQFKNQPVEQEIIDKILQAGRYCPTGGNSQSTAYTILGSQQDSIEQECVSLFGSLVKAGAVVVPLLKNLTIDKHFFFKGAPLVIAVSGKSDVDAALAASYMELMAESQGLGVLYSGFFAICAKLSPKVRKMLHLPKGHHVVTCMIMGYPDVHYKRIPPRKPLNVKTL